MEAISYIPPGSGLLDLMVSDCKARVVPTFRIGMR
jgi:hypothetical protein